MATDDTTAQTATEATANPVHDGGPVVIADEPKPDSAAEAQRRDTIREVGYLRATGQTEKADELAKSLADPGTVKTPEEPSDDQPAGDDAGDEQPQETGKAEKPGETPEDRRALMVARAALERDGWEAGDIDAMKPERLLAMGEKIRKRQAATDRAGAKLARAIRDTQAAAKKTQDGQEADGAEPASTRTPLDELLAEIDGADGAGEREAEEAPEPVASTPARPSRDREELHRTRVLLAEREVMNDFPGLKDPVHREAVGNEMAVLDPTYSALNAGHEAVAAVMRKAAFIVFGPELKNKQQTEQSRRERAKQARAVVAGQPDVESRPANKSRTLTPDQIRKAAFESSREANAASADQKFKELIGRAVPQR